MHIAFIQTASLVQVPIPYAPSYNNSFVAVNGPRGWGVLCARFLSLQAANVICRNTRNEFVARIRSGEYEGNSTRYGGIISCTGTEVSLSECGLDLLTTSTCSGGEAIIDCSSSMLFVCCLITDYFLFVNNLPLP